VTTPTSEEGKITGRRRDLVIGIDKAVLKLAKRWLALLNTLVFLYVGVPFLAPVFMHFGLPGPANTIHSLYSLVCHQFAFRSWYLFGDQPAYPRARAGLPGGNFEEYAARDPYFAGIDVSTLDNDLAYAAKGFVGNAEMGYKVALCQRDVAIYGGLLLFGLVFGGLTRRGVKVPPLQFWQYILIALVPIGLDGVSQIFANPPFDGFGLAWYPIRESTPLLRTLTGALFGIGNGWLAYPYIEETMQETEERITSTLRRAGEL
jgi:uncharacterized membrane protein